MKHAKKGKGPAVAAGIAGVLLIGGVVALGQFDLRVGSRPGSGVTPTPGYSASGPSSSVEATHGPTASPSQVPSTVTGSPKRATPTAGATGSPRRETAAACSREIAAGEAAVQAAGTAADGWRVHLRTRNDLLAGRISRETAQKIWDRTLVAGQGHLALLASAAAARAEDRGSCAKVTGPAANSCRQRMGALDAAVSAGRATADDWAEHIEKMKAHAAHQFGRQHAQALWVAAWRGAPKNLDAFARAEAAVAKAPPCRPL